MQLGLSSKDRKKKKLIGITFWLDWEPILS